MLIANGVNTIKVLAVDNVAEQILQTTGENISRLSKLGENYDVNAIRAELHGKVFLMLLRRTFGKQNESQRKMLLVSFHEVTDTAESTSSMLDDENTRAANKGKAISETQSPLSPLKRAMSEITITPETSTKKKLFLMDDALQADDETTNPKT
ncbi:hypothetical protein LIER_38093 [Lithospermum erythrorhizon]|uniref:Uncharacterized protein n=1 Tax=Lithospermum erythrorhizon TaxID=34254 RepID=A0AAV3PWI3_LITER